MTIIELHSKPSQVQSQTVIRHSSLHLYLLRLSIPLVLAFKLASVHRNFLQAEWSASSRLHLPHISLTVKQSQTLFPVLTVMD